MCIFFIPASALALNIYNNIIKLPLIMMHNYMHVAARLALPLQ